NLDAPTRANLEAYLPMAVREKHPSPFAKRQQMLAHLGCVRCHQRDSDSSPPLEEIGRTLWSPFLARMPFQRTPPLTSAGVKYAHDYLNKAIREGVSTVRPEWYSYRMPSFGARADEIVRALAEGDGGLPDANEPTRAPEADPTLSTLGPSLVGATGYSCTT